MRGFPDAGLTAADEEHAIRLEMEIGDAAARIGALHFDAMLDVKSDRRVGVVIHAAVHAENQLFARLEAPATASKLERGSPSEPRQNRRMSSLRGSKRQIVKDWPPCARSAQGAAKAGAPYNPIRTRKAIWLAAGAVQDFSIAKITKISMPGAMKLAEWLRKSGVSRIEFSRRLGVTPAP